MTLSVETPRMEQVGYGYAQVGGTPVMIMMMYEL